MTFPCKIVYVLVLPDIQLREISNVGVKFRVVCKQFLSNVMIMHVEVLELRNAKQVDKIWTSHEPQVCCIL